MAKANYSALSLSTGDEYLVLDADEDSFPEELSSVEAIVTRTFSHFSSIEAMEDRHLDRATLAYCHFVSTLTTSLATLQTTYKLLQKKAEFDRWRDNWNLLKALTLKLQSKLMALEGALPLFIDEKVISVSLEGKVYRSTKQELEERHRDCLALVTRTADELTSNELC